VLLAAVVGDTKRVQVRLPPHIRVYHGLCRTTDYETVHAGFDGSCDLECIDESAECDARAFGPRNFAHTPGLLASRLRRIWVAVLGIAPSISACASNGC
jgi:hypothetical protein